MTRNKSGCGCSGSGNNTPRTGCKNCKSGNCRRCGDRQSRTQFKFTGTTPGIQELTKTVTYLGDPGSNFSAQAALQSYPLALSQDITTLSVNVLTAVPGGQKLEVEVLRDGAPLPIPLKVTYLENEVGLKFLVTDPQTFNGADSPSSSKLDVAVTQSLVLLPGTLAPITLSAVVG